MARSVAATRMTPRSPTLQPMSHLNHEQHVSVLEQVRNRVCHAVFRSLNVAVSPHGPENRFWS